MALLAVSTAHCQCTIEEPSNCSMPSGCSRTPIEFMEQYSNHPVPVDISVRIDNLHDTENSPAIFNLCNSPSLERGECNLGVCDSTCGIPPPRSPKADCWHYVCDYDPQRIPQYLYHAECNERLQTTSGPPPTEVLYRIPVLRTETPSCDPHNSTAWKWEMQVVSVACVCDNHEER